MSTLQITKGDTYKDSLLWESSEVKFVKATTAPGAPLILNVTAHGIPDGWPVRIEGSRHIDEAQRLRVKVINADSFSVLLNGLKFSSETVAVKYNAPVDLEGYSARMQIKDKVGGTVLLSLTSAAESGSPRIVIDTAAHKIEREIPASVTADLSWKSGVFDMEMVQGDYVIKIDQGPAKVEAEVTTA